MAGEMDEGLIGRLGAVAAVRRDEPLARHTTFGIGGPADVFVTVRSAAELTAAVNIAREAGEPAFVLGAGSNILVGDAGIRGVVIDNQAKGIEGPRSLGGEHILRAESGVSFASLARSLARQGYGGIEWACGIPGTLGGAAVYNAGAYGGCLADVLRSIVIVDAAGATRNLPAAELKLTYRNSAFTRGEFAGVVVLSLEITVTPGDRIALLRSIAEHDAQRLGAQPRGRNSGSTFKNPEGQQAWQLIDAVGLRGHRIGNARISEKHCNFFENLGGAGARDVAALMREAQRRVKERFGIDLENEVELVGEGFA
ncbi:MAG: UDP-N-acetylmuramate dehydrogenase [Chloroflexi bacterium]|nr:UDP-N-acetylmuramate dehydrogenase [Chloroflexota bacterium]